MHEDKLPEIARAFCEVLEKQVFLFPEPLAGEELIPGPEGFLVGAMTFKGPARGGLMLALPEAMALEMAANFLGMEPGDPFVAESSRDSLGEILNVTCGHMLTALYGETEVFDLSIPRSFSLTGLEVAILARKPGSLAFSVDDHRVLLQVSFCNQCPQEKPDAFR
jgi:CheY-specific phosphatase CheX